MEYRQSKKAIYVSYAVYRWLFAYVTLGFFILYDWLNYKNTRLTLEEKFIVFVTGAFVTHSKEIPYEDIMKVRVDQSFIGAWFDYGTVNIIMKEREDTLKFKYVHSPEAVRKAIQEKFVTSTKLKIN